VSHDASPGTWGVNEPHAFARSDPSTLSSRIQGHLAVWMTSQMLTPQSPALPVMLRELEALALGL